MCRGQADLGRCPSLTETCCWKAPSLEDHADFPKVSAKAWDMTREVVSGSSAPGSLLLAMLDHLLLESTGTVYSSLPFRLFPPVLS